MDWREEDPGLPIKFGPCSNAEYDPEPVLPEGEVNRARRDRGERESGRRCAPIPRQRLRREAHREPIERQANRAEAGARRDGGGAHEVVARFPARADDEHLRVRRTGREPRGGGGDASRRVGADDEASLAAQWALPPTAPARAR